MCGICGLVRSDPGGDIDVAAVERMNAAMAHRGPDDAGLWHDAHVALAMRRLSILDLPGGHQPMANEDGSIIVVFNGEIYNYQEIREDLVKCGHVFRTQGDTEVIVHAYEQYGDGALDRFNGMFAFALWDTKQERLLLARDRVGIKPLFYSLREGTLLFASELDALLRSRLIPAQMNSAALDAYFTFLYVPAPDTIIRDVHKLRPGEKLVFDRGRITTERYWRAAFRPDATWTLDTAAERYRDLLKDAVRLQRISDVPLGAFLSGGIDSSAVTGILSQISTRPVRTFTIGFEDAQANESPFARIAAQHFHTDHTELILKPDMIGVIPQLVQHFGEPFADSSAIPMWFVSELARRQVTVALSGDGGDELFAGYTWLHMNRKVAAYRAVPYPLRALLNVTLRVAPASPILAKLRRFNQDSFLDPRDSFRRRQTCFQDAERAALYRPEFAAQIAANAVDRFQEHADAGPADPDDWMLHQDTAMYLPDDILTKVDRMSMAHSLEARVPLLDHRLVEFAATLPFGLKLEGNLSKRVVKHAVRDLLPPALLQQRKQGFAIPIQRWFREDLRAYFQETVLSEDAHCGDYLNREHIRSLLFAHTSGRENFGHHLWSLLMFEHWLRYTSAERHR